MTDDERRDDVRKTAPTSSATKKNAKRSNRSSRPSPKQSWKNPETRWGDPENDLPKIPSVRIPSVGGDGEGATEFNTDADPEQARLFWGSVVLANIALAGVTVGPMLIFFRNEWTIGIAAIVLGIISFTRVYAMYNEFQAHDWSKDDESEDGEMNDDESTAKTSGDTEHNP